MPNLTAEPINRPCPNVRMNKAQSRLDAGPHQPPGRAAVTPAFLLTRMA